MANYLITGGCGFIGSHLADALTARGDRVTILDDLSTGSLENAPREAEVVVGDVRDSGLVERLTRRVEGCFHLAAVASVTRSSEAWLETHSINQGATVNLLEAARKGRNGPLPVVYASSAAVYGDNANTPLREEDELRPLSAYGADKLGCELHARVAGMVHRVPTAGLRFFNVYGPRQDPRSPYSGVISIFADHIRRGLPITLHGDGGQVRDFIYVGDVVRFLLAALERASTTAPVFNVCTGRATSIRQLATTLFAVSGRRTPIQQAQPRPGDIRTSIGAPEKALRELGIAARQELGEGLRCTYRRLQTEERALSA